MNDEQFCTDEGLGGAHCNNFLTDDPEDIPKDRWDAMRFGMTCITDQAKADFKAELEIACSDLNCDYNTQKKIEEGFKRIGTQ